MMEAETPTKARGADAALASVHQAEAPIAWITAPGLSDYAQSVAWMEARVAAIAAGTAPECLWLVEHPPIYTAGTSARPGDLVAPKRFPVFQTGRGGQYTYHGPGQRVAYVMLDLSRRGRDVRLFVASLEEWSVSTCVASGGKNGLACGCADRKNLPGQARAWRRTRSRRWA
jgi:lipoyl(octanoyl) transferase